MDLLGGPHIKKIMEISRGLEEAATGGDQEDDNPAWQQLLLKDHSFGLMLEGIDPANTIARPHCEGLYAADLITAGSFVTTYPTHILLHTSKEGGERYLHSAAYAGAMKLDTEARSKIQEWAAEGRYAGGGIYLSPRLKVLADKHLGSDPWYRGHLVRSWPATGLKGPNCALLAVGPLNIVVATVNIARGTELALAPLEAR